jgi:hypothetical protein
MTERRTSSNANQRRKADPPKARRGVASQKEAGRPNTRQQQEKYLEGLRQFGTLVHACQLAHVSPHTIYSWREHDPDFSLRENEAQEGLTQDLEREALRRASEGYLRPVFQRGQLIGHERCYSDSLLAMMLKARRPDRYRENVNFSGCVEQIVREVQGFDPREVL